jgi:hypothetical protein
MIWDDEAQEAAAHSEMMRESEAAGALGRAADVDSLARAVHVGHRLLRKSLAPSSGRRPLTAPYH